MKGSDAVKQIQGAVLDLEKTGAKEVLINNLNAYLANVLTIAEGEEREVPPLTEAQANHQLEVWKAQLSSNSMMSIEMLKATIEAGQTALRSAIVVNGGAAATVLAFAGNAITKGQIRPGMPLLTQIGSALFWFMLGVGSAGVASGFRYLSQASYSVHQVRQQNGLWGRMGVGANVISIVLGVFSFVAFFIGGIAAYHAVVAPVG